MDKRFVSFLLVSLAVLLGYSALRAWLNPAPPPAAVAQADKEKPDDQPKPAAEEKPGEEKPAEEKPAEPGANEPAEAETPPAAAGETPAVGAAPVKLPQRWLTLGSVDPNSPYRMLVTFTSKGAAVVRAELSSLTYRDLEDDDGYLGHLELSDAEDGARINAVGAGTPAALASSAQISDPGLKAGDVIVSIGEVELVTGAIKGFADHANELLHDTRPGETLSITVRRGEGESAEELTFKVSLTPPPMAVIHPEHRDVFNDESPLQSFSFLTTFSQAGSSGSPSATGYSREEIAGIPSLHSSNWEVLENDQPDEVAFRYVLDEAAVKKLGLSGQLALVKRFRLAKVDPNAGGAAYHLTMTLEVQNLGAESATFGLQQMGPTGLPIEGWWYLRKASPDWGPAGMRDIVWRGDNGSNHMVRNPVILQNAQTSPPIRTPILSGNQKMDYVGVDAVYFSSAILPDKDAKSFTEQKFRYQYGEAFITSDIDPVKFRRSTTGVSFRLISHPIQLAGGETWQQQYTVFIGPKDPGILKAYGLQDTIIFGWEPFATIARILVWVLNLIYSVIGNYGLAIISLTVLVRLCVYPIGRKQAQNAQKMQELAPQLKEIAEKHKEMEARARAQQELFKKHNYNPLGGCWLLFLQMPIFIGLYKALSVSIDLRQASLIPGIRWCSNLAGPDMLWYWREWEFLPNIIVGYDGYLGPYLNILPLFTIVLFLVHQKLFMPPPTDEQQVMQQRMMNYVMVFMGFLFFKVPSGLCIYFITSSLWGIAERYLLPKTKKPVAAAPTSEPAKKTLPSPSPDKSKPKEGGLANWLANVAAKPKIGPATKSETRADRRGKGKNKKKRP